MCWVRGNKKQTDSITSRLSSSALSVILRREQSELSGESRNIMAISFDEANSVFSRFLIVIAGRVPAIWVQRVTNLVNTLAILSNGANSTTSRLSSVITGFIPVILVQQVTNQVNKLAVLFKRSMLRQDSRDKPENDGVKRAEVLNSVFNASSLNVMLRSKPSVTIKSALILTAFMLFSAAAQATVCFLPDGNCGGVFV